MEAGKHCKAGHDIIMIGHEGQPEGIGTMVRLPGGAITLVEDEAQAETVQVADPEDLGVITQTTLSVDDTAAIMDILTRRFPTIRKPRKEDICYATTNRQLAVKDVAAQSEVLLVVGAPTSSNSKRLVEVADRVGCRASLLVERASDLDWDLIGDARTVGITAGASAPEVLVQELIDAFRERFAVEVVNIAGAEEGISFKLPRLLLD